jgi:hypothetical protein
VLPSAGVARMSSRGTIGEHHIYLILRVCVRWCVRDGHNDGLRMAPRGRGRIGT